MLLVIFVRHNLELLNFKIVCIQVQHLQQGSMHTVGDSFLFQLQNNIMKKVSTISVHTKALSENIFCIISLHCCSESEVQV
jgi:hypothetical protein